MPHEEEQFDTLPPAIVEALRELDGPAVLPDAERDADVLSGARRHLGTGSGARGLSRKRRNLRLFIGGSAGGALAAAAVLGVAFILNSPSHDEAPNTAMEMAEQDAIPTIAEDATTRPPTATAQAGDLDRNGRVDILDAYALARRIAQDPPAQPLDSNVDLNGDGETDQRDIDWIANQAVALNSGEQS